MRLGRLCCPADPPRPAAVLQLALLLLICPAVISAAAELPPVDTPSTDPESWLEVVRPLLTPSEASVYLRLRHDYQRQEFINRFWRERDPFPETGSNEFLETWVQRLQLAQERFGNLSEDRAEALLLAGPPSAILTDPCPHLLAPLEIWTFEASHFSPRAFTLVFVEDTRAKPSRFVHWTPSSDLGSLIVSESDPSKLERSSPAESIRHCRRGAEIAAALSEAVDWQRLRAEAELVPSPSGEWAEAFLARSADLPPGASLLPASVEFAYPGRLRDRTILQALITIPLDQVSLGAEVESPGYSFEVDGEVIKHDTLVESFRYRFDLPHDTVAGGVIPLIIERHLRPQTYRMALRVEDRNSHRFFREERELQVPSASSPGAVTVPETGGPTADGRGDFEARLTESTMALGSGQHSIKIVTPSSELHTGRLRVEAIARGDAIAKVTFVLNGKPVMSKTRPPYSVEIDLGRAPRLHALEALAVGDTGKVLARDRLPINAGGHRFALRLLEPQLGQHFASSLRAVAEVDVPRGEALDRVELYLDKELVVSLYQPPYAQPIPLPGHQRITYVRAVAYLQDGNSTEDLVFINAPEHMHRIRVDLVELYTSVSDRGGSPVEGLRGEDFQILEEGVPQQILRFERVRDLPIHAGILLDTSTSMAEELSEAVEGALRFFEGVVQPRDRAAVVVFNDAARLAVPFTNNHQILAGGLADLEAGGETALFDSLVFTLHYFSGIRGKRALIVLSDGEDSSSRYSFDETLEFARRSGIAIYSIGLGLPTRELDVRMRLQRFATDTGGRYFFISEARELSAIYESIEAELRFQYLLAYQSSNSDGDAFRRVEVRMSQPGLEAKTVPGYYP